MSSINASIGKKFKDLRSQVGLDQLDVSKMLDIPITAMSLLESGQRDITISEFDKLCRIYRVSPNELLGWNRTRINESKK